MSVTRIATRYAKSLIELAIEQNKLEAVGRDIDSLRQAARHRELYLLLKSPIVQADKKTAVLDALFKDKLDALTLAYLRLLVNKGREGYIPEIAAEFTAQYKALKGITSVRLVTAAPVGDSVVQELRDRIVSSGVATGSLDIETRVDPTLIGGFVLEFDNKRYDASVAHKLEELKTQFSKNLYIREF